MWNGKQSECVLKSGRACVTLVGVAYKLLIGIRKNMYHMREN